MPTVENERDCYRAALERIAGQGIGRWDPNARCTVGNTGEPWKHWATIAKEALAAGAEIDEQFARAQGTA